MNSKRPRYELYTHHYGRDQELANVVGENIDSIVKMRLAEERKKGLQAHIADLLTRFSGSMIFVYVHAIWFVLWVAFNVGWIGANPSTHFHLVC